MPPAFPLSLLPKKETSRTEKAQMRGYMLETVVMGSHINV